MASQLNRIKFKWERISAIDGRESLPADNASHPAVYSTGELTRSEIGAFESHRKAWQMVVNRGIASAIIMEDDVYLSTDFELIEFDKFDEFMDIVKLDMSYLSNSIYGAPAIYLKNGRWLVKAIGKEATSGCYFITNRAARRLLAWSNRYTVPVDRFLFTWDTKYFWKSKIGRVVPACAIDSLCLSKYRFSEVKFKSSIVHRYEADSSVQINRFSVKRWGIIINKILRLDFHLLNRLRSKSALRRLTNSG